MILSYDGARSICVVSFKEGHNIDVQKVLDYLNNNNAELTIKETV